MGLQALDLQYRKIEHRINSRVRSVLEHGQYIMGPEVFELEESLAKFVGVKHCVSCANGTDALTLAMMALDVGPKDLVVCPTFSFFASAEAAAILGADVIFVDSSWETFNICPLSLEKTLAKLARSGRPQPRAIIAVDLFGLPADYTLIRPIADHYGVPIIEDGAQGFGGRIGDQQACSFGDISVTSFFPSKPLGCYGDGGAIFTDSDSLADLCRSLRVHGQSSNKYNNVRIGMNSRLDTLQAAILLEKLTIFEAELEAKNRLASQYDAWFKDKFEVPTVPEGFTSAWAQYTLKVTNRSHLIEIFKNRQIETGTYYERCIHEQVAFQPSSNILPLPNACRLAQSCLSLPMNAYIGFNESVFANLD